MDIITQCYQLGQELSSYFPDSKPRRHAFSMILAGIIWIVKTGAQWSSLPSGFPPKSTCHYWFTKLNERYEMSAILTDILINKRFLKSSNLEESYMDGSFIRAKGGGESVGKTKIGKGNKLMVVVDKEGVPSNILIDNARPHEVSLVDSLLKKQIHDTKPKRIIADKAYDSTKLTEKLSQMNIELIAPHRSNRKVNVQDGRKLRRYKRRWKVEQFFAHLHNYRKTIVRYEKKISNFCTCIYLAIISIYLLKNMKKYKINYVG